MNPLISPLKQSRPKYLNVCSRLELGEKSMAKSNCCSFIVLWFSQWIWLWFSLDRSPTRFCHWNELCQTIIECEYLAIKKVTSISIWLSTDFNWIDQIENSALSVCYYSNYSFLGWSESSRMNWEKSKKLKYCQKKKIFRIMNQNLIKNTIHHSDRIIPKFLSGWSIEYWKLINLSYETLSLFTQ